MRRKPMAPSEPADYRRWKTRCAALLKRLGVPAGPWSRERDLRVLYIKGATPEQAAQEVQVTYWNTRTFEPHGQVAEMTAATLFNAAGEGSS